MSTVEYTWQNHYVGWIDGYQFEFGGLTILGNIKIDSENISRFISILENWYSNDKCIESIYNSMSLESKEGMCSSCSEYHETTLRISNRTRNGLDRKSICPECCSMIISQIKKINNSILLNDEYIHIMKLDFPTVVPEFPRYDVGDTIVCIGKASYCGNIHFSLSELNSFIKDIRDYCTSEYYKEYCEICKGRVEGKGDLVKFNNERCMDCIGRVDAHCHQKCLVDVINTLEEFSEKNTELLSSILI